MTWDDSTYIKVLLRIFTIETEKFMHTLIALTTTLAAFVNLSTAEPDITAPEYFQYGSTVTDMQTVLASVCEELVVRELALEELPFAQSSHTQIDCHGMEFAGRNRHAEFVFADDALAFVWVLTESDEEGRLLNAMTSEYGTPSHATTMFTAFTDHNTALRHDTPEFLFYSPLISAMYRNWFDQMASE